MKQAWITSVRERQTEWPLAIAPSNDRLTTDIMVLVFESQNKKIGFPNICKIDDSYIFTDTVLDLKF